MKRKFALLLAVMLALDAVPAFAEASLETAVEAVRAAATLDDQLTRLCDLSVNHAAELENGGWDVDLDLEPAGVFPESFTPNVDNADTSDGLPEELQDAKFVVFCDEFETDGGFVRRTIPGGLFVRLPEANRSRSLAEADAVLYITHGYERIGGYTGEAYARVYQLYAAPLDGGTVYSIDSTGSHPPEYGIGILVGARLSAHALWQRFEPAIYNVPLVVEYPEGTAAFRVTEGGCCMIGLEGNFTRFEVPQEVEGRAVVGIEKIRRDSLEELILPEGLEWISGSNAIECQFLKRIQFPSTLKRIDGKDVFWYNPWPGHPLDTLAFNEGLEEIGEDALPGSRCIKSITLPSTLREVGWGFLSSGLGCTWVVLPEGMTKLPGEFLNASGYVECVYLPASLTDFAYNALNQGSIHVYTPAGSPASAWAEKFGFTWFPCDSAEDMPKPAVETEGDIEYLVLNDEAILLRYNGTDEEVTVPETLGGAPVRVIKRRAFDSFSPGNDYSNRVRVLRLPDTVRLLESTFIRDGRDLEAVYVPGPVEKCVDRILDDCPKCTVYSPASSPVRDACESYDIPWAEWEPDGE